MDKLNDVVLFCVNFLHLHSKFLIGLIIILFLIVAEFIIIEIIKNKTLLKLRKKVTDYPIITTIPLMAQTTKFVLAFIMLAVFIQSMGYNVTSLLAGAGIVGLAIAIAAQTTLGNIFGAFSLLTDKVYQIGDYIQFDDKAGYIESINLRSTTLRTTEGFYVNVPNNLLSSIAVTNVSHATKYKIDLKVAIECDTPLEKLNEALTILQKIADEEPSVPEKMSLAYIEDLSGTAINLRMVCYTDMTNWFEYTKLKSNMFAQIIDEYRKANIELDIPDSKLTINRDVTI